MLTSEQVKKMPNQTGKGGFQQGQSGNPGGRPKNQESFTYWLNQFKQMTILEFNSYPKIRGDALTIAESIAYGRIKASFENLSEFKDVANRTERSNEQTIIINGVEL